MKILGALVLLLAFSAQGKELHSVTMGDDEMVGTQKLKLKGMGLREETILAIMLNVYVAGLYVTDLKPSCDELIKSDKTKMVHMKFLMRVGTSDLNNSMQEGVKRNCDVNCDAVVAKVKTLKDLVPTAHTGDSLKIAFTSKDVSFSLNDKPLGHVEGGDVSRALFAAFVGPRPATEALKKGLCGL